MKRLVILPRNSLLKGFNRYHKQILETEIKDSVVSLNITESGGYYLLNDEEVFCVCKGVGFLEYKDYSKNLDFTRLLPFVIEDYLFKAKEPEDKSQLKLLREFLEVYEKNIQKNELYLNPPYFEKLESELLRQ
ncbi:hypothetical protein [Helicobacter cetorum]|uniref:hypothetical protein n=1 Tax=Helicobacter cetorum TaxID=138563 RepID=UPI000CF18876|nr:hypothetical protein [Helicobacter cetorum]